MGSLNLEVCVLIMGIFLNCFLDASLCVCSLLGEGACFIQVFAFLNCPSKFLFSFLSCGFWLYFLGNFLNCIL